MIKVTVKKPWQGKIACHEKYIRMAKSQRTGIEFTSLGEKMRIQAGDIDVLGTLGKENFTERYGPDMGNKYRLWYFDWKPEKEERQTKLF